MPQGNDYFGDTKEALRMMIPLVINRRNIEANAEEQDKRISALKEQYDAQLQRDILKQKAEEEQAKRKFQAETILKRLDRAEETQSPEQFQELASKLSGLGVQLPTYFSAPEGVNRFQMLPPKPEKENLPNSLEAVMARDMTPDQAMKAKKDLIEWTQKQEDAYRPRTAEEKLPPEVKAALDFLKAHKETQQMSLTNALVSSLPGIDPSVREMLSKQQGVSPETESLRAQSQAVLDRYYQGKSGGAPKADDKKEMTTMPPASQHSGRTIRDTKSGKRFKSDGSTWVEIK